LATLPPIQFLKRYSPRLRRRKRPTIGFDQPPRELKELAFPLRPAPPTLSNRLRIRFARVTAKTAFTFGRLTTRATALGHRAMAPVLTAYALAVAAISPLVERLTGRLMARLAALQPAPWQVTQTAALLTRTHRVRRALVGTMVCEWTAVTGLTLIVLARLVTGRPLDSGIVNGCGLAVCGLGFAALTLHAWLQHLVAAWRSLEVFICGECGELRNFSPSLPCSGCHSEALPVFPGQMHPTWSACNRAIGSILAGAPVATIACLVLAGRLIAR
jgi:hypothetical protein